MPQKIQILPVDLVNKIAAGEVVERPASVVKELVENSIDAQAQNILIEVKDGGKKLIRVTDDGSGMSPEDLERAVARHATSKIGSVEDLSCIHTLGFRGEALAALASASHMTLISRDALSPVATQLKMASSEVSEIKKIAFAQGTQVTVADLFIHLPARAKFLRAAQTELSHIHSFCEAVALTYPAIAFRLVTDHDKTSFYWRATGDLTQRVHDVLDYQVGKDLFSFEGGGGGVRIKGFLSRPELTRSQASGFFLFVNGRWVQDRLLWHAVREAYENLIMRGRYPIVVLYLEIPFDAVDVNVHPAKAQVRFQEPHRIHDLIVREMRACLKTSPWVREQKFSISSASPDRSHAQAGRPWSETLTKFASGKIATSVEQQMTLDDPISKEATAGTMPFLGLEVIGQLWHTYILCQTEEKLVLIDQHAAHERIGFEELKRLYQAGMERETLLVPLIFDLAPSETEILNIILDDLMSFGLELSYLGQTTFAIKSQPVLLHGKLHGVEWLKDLIEEYRASGHITKPTEMVHHVLETMACHRQVRAGDKLSLSEMQCLLMQLHDEDFAYHCPHGRPVMIEITRDQVERWFKRRL